MVCLICFGVPIFMPATTRTGPLLSTCGATPAVTPSSTYKSFRQFNKTRIGALAASRSSIKPHIAEEHFASDSLQDRFVREMAKQRALPVKEILESFEFFACVRKRLRAPHVTDLCCGHGLTGILFALFERTVEQVLLIDRQEPPNHAGVLACAIRVGPWVADKVRYQTAPMKRAAAHVEPSTSIMAIHACGRLTDRCIDCALEAGGAMALMPCCYPDSGCEAPAALQLSLGTRLAYDIDRTYRLQAAGYHVRWGSVPEEITPMNRVLIGTRSPASPRS